MKTLTLAVLSFLATGCVVTPRKHVQDIDELIPITGPELEKPGRLPVFRRVTQARVAGAIRAGIAAPWQTYDECVNEWAGGPIPLGAFAACANVHRTEPLPVRPYTQPKL